MKLSIITINWNDADNMSRTSSERFASMAAISRATGINQRQLSHYATGLKTPRPKQRQRIVEGLHKIGRELMAFA